MNSKQLIGLLKQAVREVVKEELTEILREGLQSTINEMAKPKKTSNMSGHRTPPPPPSRKSKVQFNENKWASVLNETDAIQSDETITSYSDLLNESYDDTMTFTSRDAQGFGMTRQNMNIGNTAPKKMEDPETGKVYDVAPEVQQAMTRDYSALMAAINKKKG